MSVHSSEIKPFITRYLRVFLILSFKEIIYYNRLNILFGTLFQKEYVKSHAHQNFYKAMLNPPRLDDTNRYTFSGHGTFPMRYGWLKKSYDALAEAVKTGGDVKDVFSDKAITKFGVGKNMVSSMRHWCYVTNIIEKDNSTDKDRLTNKDKLSDFANEIFADKGLDPYLENPITLWILHYSLATNPQLLTYYWFFNINNSLNLDRKTLQNEVAKYCAEQEKPIPSATTLKRDVECFVRLYMYRSSQNNDDAVESPLTELGLIVPIHKPGFFAGNRGTKPTLPSALFWSSVFHFWKARYEEQNTLSLSQLAYQELSPGRVFLLDEASIIEYIYSSSHLFNEHIKWSETAGNRELTLSGTTLDKLITKSNCLTREAYAQKI